MTRTDFISFIGEYQQGLCDILEKEDGAATFMTDEWKRPEGGGGTTRILENGKVIEKAGVNTSVVYGPVTAPLAQQLQSAEGKQFFACGVSVVIHPGKTDDNMRGDDYWFEFSKANACAFIDTYLPIVVKRWNESYSERQVRWQEIRRGRYVEFNLIHDRGTLFGLRSGGRTESILMSLPPRARFDYNDVPPAGSDEEKLINVLKPQVNDGT